MFLLHGTRPLINSSRLLSHVLVLHKQNLVRFGKCIYIPSIMNVEVFVPDNTLSTTTISAIHAHNPKSHGSLDADIIIKNAPDPVFVSDLEGKILSANDAVYELLGFRTDEVL